MSILFGLRQSEGDIVREDDLQILAQATGPWAQDGTLTRVEGSVGLGFQPNHTHERSFLESAVFFDPFGNIAAMDGRLDNHTELRELLHMEEPNPPDSMLVLAAFQQWGAGCFARFIGDWALAIWSRVDRLLYLARDHAGSRTLYYERNARRVTWSTYLEAFRPDRSSTALDPAYAVRYLCALPLQERTPYCDLHAVSPGHYVVFGEGTSKSVAHWQPIARGLLAYQDDREYEEQFRALFQQSVARRIGLDGSVLAQLSGGMDSTSIVCMADTIRLRQNDSAKHLPTLSYYDDGEANWDDRFFFTEVEKKRGCTGVHVAISYLDRSFDVPDSRYLIPGPDASMLRTETRIADALGSDAYRTMLSGIGGDELLGGVPDPLPELANYLAAAQPRLFLRQSIRWCLERRQPLIELLPQALRFAASSYFGRAERRVTLPTWVTRKVITPFEEESLCHRVRTRFGKVPSVLSHRRGWQSVMESLPSPQYWLGHRFEYRYPYLDRELVEFLLRVPPEQMLRPSERRSLMRRSLKEIVPSVVLERKRKAYYARGVLALLEQSSERLRDLFASSMLADLGLIEPSLLLQGLEDLLTGRGVGNPIPILAAAQLELWLRARSSHAAGRVPHEEAAFRAATINRFRGTACVL